MRRPGVRGVSGQEQDGGDASVPLLDLLHRHYRQAARNRTGAKQASPPRSTPPPPLRIRHGISQKIYQRKGPLVGVQVERVPLCVIIAR